jgi:hypothetical protein
MENPIFDMNPGSSSLDDALKSRSTKVVRAVTWFGILAGAVSFWVLAGLMAWAYLRP